jgi:hypothetical protein
MSLLGGQRLSVRLLLPPRVIPAYAEVLEFLRRVPTAFSDHQRVYLLDVSIVQHTGVETRCGTTLIVNWAAQPC